MGIRENSSGSYQNLTNDDGQITSHIIGMLTRTIRLMEAGIKPVDVFDGKPPELKLQELAARREKRDEAKANLAKAVEEGLTKFLVDQCSFSKERVERYIERLQKSKSRTKQRPLTSFFGAPKIDIKDSDKFDPTKKKGAAAKAAANVLDKLLQAKVFSCGIVSSAQQAANCERV